MTVIYTYEETNDGTHAMAWVTVTDDMCAPVTFVNGDINSNGLLDPGETWTYTCTRTFTDPGTYRSSVTATGLDTVVGGPHVEQAETTVEVLPHTACDLEIVKTMSPEPLLDGQSAIVTITVTNVGNNFCTQPGTGSPTVMSDAKPAGVTFTGAPLADKTGWACALDSGGNAGCSTFQFLSPGYTVTFTINAVVSTLTGPVTNCAGVSNFHDTILANNESCVSSDVLPASRCDLRVVKTVSPTPVVHGQTATATIKVSNVGTAPCTGTTEVFDILGGSYSATGAGPTPPGWTCTVYPPPAGDGGGGLRCTNPGPLAAGYVTTFVLDMHVDVDPSGGNLENCAGVHNAADPFVTDPDLRGNNWHCVDPGFVRPAPQCDLEVTKDMSPTPLVSGRPVTVTFTVANVGTGPCAPGYVNPYNTGTLLYDNKPAGITFTSVTKADQPGWICWGIDYGVPDAACLDFTTTFPPGYVATMTVEGSVTAPAGASVANCVRLYNGNDVNAFNNTACVTNDVVAAVTATTCDLEMVKSMEPTPLVSDETMTVTLTVTNVGTGPCLVPSGLAGPQVVDYRPQGLLFTSFSHPSGWACRLNAFNFFCEGPVTPLPAGYSATFTIDAQVTAPAGRLIMNCAVAGTNDKDIDEHNNAVCVTSAVVDRRFRARSALATTEVDARPQDEAEVAEVAARDASETAADGEALAVAPAADDPVAPTASPEPVAQPGESSGAEAAVDREERPERRSRASRQSVGD